MSDFVLNALLRKRAIAEKAGLLERVERMDARLAQPTKPAKRSEPKQVEVDATDAAIELAAGAGIDLGDVEGSGEGGRILKSDVERAIEAAEG